MSGVWLGCIVEGEGEVSALPCLIRRIAAQIDPGLSVQVPRPVRVNRNRVAEQFGDLDRAVELALKSLQKPCSVLVLLDADDDDPLLLTTSVQTRLRAARSDVPLAVVVAVREYEAWFLAAVESIQGRRGLAAELPLPPNPEAIRDAKGWLRQHMPGSRSMPKPLTRLP